MTNVKHTTSNIRELLVKAENLLLELDAVVYNEDLTYEQRYHIVFLDGLAARICDELNMNLCDTQSSDWAELVQFYAQVQKKVIYLKEITYGGKV